MIAIIDYDAGNIRSIQKALETLTTEVVVTRDKNIILSADKVVLPGVGAFGDVVNKIRDYDLEDTINKVVSSNKPFLSICIGLQLLFDESEEAPGTKGLSVFNGKIIKFPNEKGYKVPHMGWNKLTKTGEGKLLKGIEEGAYMYFVHSYYLKATDRSIVKATTDYSVVFDAYVERDNIFACQFHPEKSSDIGMKFLRNFVEL
ncbi:MAG: imidazole glycerol phosphate synthase subunit HisH [Suipraeoptans sp.]